MFTLYTSYKMNNNNKPQRPLNVRGFMLYHRKEIVNYVSKKNSRPYDHCKPWVDCITPGETVSLSGYEFTVLARTSSLYAVLKEKKTGFVISVPCTKIDPIEAKSYHPQDDHSDIIGLLNPDIVQKVWALYPKDETKGDFYFSSSLTDPNNTKRIEAEETYEQTHRISIVFERTENDYLIMPTTTKLYSSLKSPLHLILVGPSISKENCDWSRNIARTSNTKKRPPACDATKMATISVKDFDKILRNERL